MSWKTKKDRKMSQELKNNILRIKQIGIQIAALSDESKSLRSAVAAAVEEQGFGHVTSDESVDLLLDNLLVSVIKERGGSKDFTVTFKELKVL